MIDVHKSENTSGTTIGAWIFDEDDFGVFVPAKDIIKLIEFVDKPGTTFLGL